MTNRTRFTTQRRRLVNFTMNSTMDIFANSDAWEFQEDGNIIAVPLNNSYKEMARKGKSFAELFVAYMKEQEGYDDYKKYISMDEITTSVIHPSVPVCSLKGGRRLSEKQSEQKTYKKHSGAFRRSMASRKHSQAKKQSRVTYNHRSEIQDGEMFVYMCPSEQEVEVSDTTVPISVMEHPENEEDYEKYMEDDCNFWEMYDMRFAAHFGFDF